MELRTPGSEDGSESGLRKEEKEEYARIRVWRGGIEWSAPGRE